MWYSVFPAIRAYLLPIYLGNLVPKKEGGSAMEVKLSTALKDLGIVAKALAIVSKAGLDVLALIKD